MSETPETPERLGEQPDREPDDRAGGEPQLGAVPDPPEPDDQVELPKANRLSRRPHDPKGVYMVIVEPPLDFGPFGEIGWFRANDDDHAKRQAVADAKAGHHPDLLEQINGDGALIRAVPARSWPKAKPTRYVRAEPRLEIG